MAIAAASRRRQGDAGRDHGRDGWRVKRISGATDARSGETITVRLSANARSSQPQCGPARATSARRARRVRRPSDAASVARAQQERVILAERRVAALAAEQQGMVTTAQLEVAGLSRTQVTRRVAGGWLVRVHTGVYRLGAYPGPWGREAAALLACGPDAALSHWTAARIDALTGRGGAEIHVSIEGRLAGRVRGIRPHRVSALPEEDVVLRHGLRVTAPARTLLDVAAVAPRDLLGRITEEAQVRRLVSAADLRAALERAAGRPGVRKLREVVEYLDVPLLTRSEAEKRLRMLVRSAALPLPRMNVRRAGWEVDAVWDAQRLVVEFDGRKFHDTGGKFERDRRKDADLVLAGYRVLRITWRRLTRQPGEVVAILAAALALGQQERARQG